MYVRIDRLSSSICRSRGDEPLIRKPRLPHYTNVSYHHVDSPIGSNCSAGSSPGRHGNERENITRKAYERAAAQTREGTSGMFRCCSEQTRHQDIGGYPKPANF